MQCGLYAIILQEFAQINWQPFSLQPGYSYQQLFSVIGPSAPGDTVLQYSIPRGYYSIPCLQIES